MPITTITIPHFATGPTPPRAASADGPNTLRTRVAEVVAKMGPPPWSRRIIQDERNLVTLIANRPGGVLNDAQIANIKRRLRLTPDQESLWPAVEVALRNISYSKKAQEMRVASAHSAPMAYVDPNSADVQRLKYAALPLIMRLNEDQKQEVRSMAHVMGLDGVASSF